MALTRRTRWAVVIAAVAVVMAGGGYAAFAMLAGGSGPAPVDISSVGSNSSGADRALTGTWKLEASRSFVGYRVREKLAMLPAPSDAVGRTAAVSGSLAMCGKSITGVDVSADLRQLHSDRSMRDERIRTIGLESDSFPTARFTLTRPIAFSKAPAMGQTVSARATGRCTLHGVTRTVTVPVRARWTGNQIVVVGSFSITFDEYGIAPPNFGPVAVGDTGTVEFQLVFV